MIFEKCFQISQDIYSQKIKIPNGKIFFDWRVLFGIFGVCKDVLLFDACHVVVLPPRHVPHVNIILFPVTCHPMIILSSFCG